MQAKSVDWWQKPSIIWVAFICVSLWLGWQGYVAEAIPYGDVSFVYEFWARQAIGEGPVVGLETQWVYPIVALIPILLPLLAGTFFAGPGSYAVGWIILATLVNALAVAALIHGDLRLQSEMNGSHNRGDGLRRQRIAAWWWLVFLVALGPIAVARLDTIVTPLAIIGLIFVARNPYFSASIITVAAWIKVWPAAVLIAMVTLLKQRWKIVSSALITSAVIVIVAAVLGGAQSIFSFLTQQTSRGLQIEAPLANAFLWMTSLGLDTHEIYYDTEILTFQVRGDGTEFFSMLSNLLLAFGVLVLLFFGWWVQRHSSDEKSLQLLPVFVLTLVLVLIVFNKVGSPQYIGWIAAPIVAGLIFTPKEFSLLAWVALALAALTHLFYPYMYQGILAAQPLELAILTLRNIGELVLFVLAIRVFYRLNRRANSAPTKSDSIKNAS